MKPLFSQAASAVFLPPKRHNSTFFAVLRVFSDDIGSFGVRHAPAVSLPLGLYYFRPKVLIRQPYFSFSFSIAAASFALSGSYVRMET